MKRSIDSAMFNNILKDDSEPNSKVILVEREENPLGISLVHPFAVGKKSYIDSMELAESTSNVGTTVHANAKNKLDIIGLQMRNLQELMTNVYEETKLSLELHNVACNFVKKPGHVYHLYERLSGQRYLGMLSPEEWQTAPHKYLGSFKLDADLSWTPAQSYAGKYEGVNFLRRMFEMSHPVLTKRV